jgi:hypothetical protein
MTGSTRLKKILNLFYIEVLQTRQTFLKFLKNCLILTLFVGTIFVGTNFEAILLRLTSVNQKKIDENF